MEHQKFEHSEQVQQYSFGFLWRIQRIFIQLRLHRLYSNENAAQAGYVQIDVPITFQYTYKVQI
jgi:hypothetical protein